MATFPLSEPSDFAASAASVTAASVVFSVSAGAAVVAVTALPPPHPASPIAMAAAVISAIILLFFIFLLLLFNSLCCPVSGCAANICSPMRTGCRTASCLYVCGLHLSVSVTQQVHLRKYILLKMLFRYVKNMPVFVYLR